MPQKYSKVQFKKDLSDLTKLINQFKQDGGKKKAKRSAVKKDVKRYTIVEVDGKKIASGEGSYTGNGHAQAARKACGRACKKRNKANLNFSLRETTQGSNKSVKHYRCKRVKLKNPVIIKYKTGAQTKITHENVVTEVSK
jgi:hypothetical protein